MLILDFYSSASLPIIIITVTAAILVFIITLSYASNPFTYSEFKLTLDASGRRNYTLEVAIQERINSEGESFLYRLNSYEKTAKEWEIKNRELVKGMLFKNHRSEQLEEVIRNHAKYRYDIVLVRNQTRYRQVNYQKYSYTVENVVEEKIFSKDYLFDLYYQLENINFEYTLDKYNSKNQRKLMTTDLRRRIMKRDNYTCQYCGKYMPDEVGIHIDHIIPVSKGGKTVESNLQVLCSKCNLSKKDK